MVTKQTVPLNFSNGLETKTDSRQLTFGKFTQFNNAVFDTLGQLTKRNGFGSLPALTSSASYLATFNNSLVAVGNDITGFSQGLNSWVKRASFTPVSLSMLPLVNNMYSQVNVDSAIAPNGLICTVFQNSDELPILSSFRYTIQDSQTGQAVVPATTITGSGGSVQFGPRVFTLNNNFVIVYDVRRITADAVAGTASFLQYVAIPCNSPLTVGSISVVSSAMHTNSRFAWDGAVASNSLYLSWNRSVGRGVASAFIGPSMLSSAISTISSTSARVISVCADVTPSGPTIWTTAGTTSAQLFVTATDAQLSTKFSTTQFNLIGSQDNIGTFTSFAQNGFATIFMQENRGYGYDAAAPDDYLSKLTFDQTNGSAAASPYNIFARSVGLGSKAFIINSTGYVLSSYSSPYQSTYFLMNSSGGVISKHAYGNAIQGYPQGNLTSAFVVGSTASIPYVYQTLRSPVNKTTAGVASTTIASYTQTGLGLANVTFSQDKMFTVEAGKNLNFNGGFLGMYDGSQFVESNAFLYPDYVEVVTGGNPAGGNMPNTTPATTYYYQVTYDWTDSKGNLFRSAPSVATGFTTSTGISSLNISIPTPRITYKTTTNPIRMSIWRWSSTQPVYYQQSPSIVMDNAALGADFITVNDAKSDSQIIGNQIIYTNGGVVEDVNGPPSTGMTLFDDRLWMIDAEDQNLLWFSKQVIEGTPVEMSDLFTIFVAPTLGTEGPTGPMKCLAPMDDKIVIFKKSALYYINGAGPDNTGQNSQYSQPTFITAAAGCSNPDSIVLIPNGLMFQSDKGIWLLGRDLSTQYIGKDVEIYNSAVVTSATAIPNTNQVRFTLNTGIDLVYDYFVGQWGTFSGNSAVSSTLYNSLHTRINSSGQVFQETPGTYLDGTTPVVMSFQTGWCSLNGVQGYSRIFNTYMLGNFISPHRLTVGVADDYDSTIQQTIVIDPTNVTGSGSSVEQWQLNFQTQQKQAFQLTFNETSSSTAGAGLTVSQFKVTVGVSKPYPRNLSASNKVG